MTSTERCRLLARAASLLVLTALVPTAMVGASAGEAQQSSSGVSSASSGDLFTGDGDGATVAVLPFVNISGSPDDQWLGTGIAETVSVDLKNLHGLSVVERDVVAPGVQPNPSGGRPPDDQTAINLGRQLGTDWVVTGGYQRVGDLIRITTRLLDVSSGLVVRTVKTDGMLSEIFDLQDQIVRGLSADTAPQAETTTPQPAVERLPSSEGAVEEESSPLTSELTSVPAPADRANTRELTPRDATGILTVGGNGVPGVTPGSTVAAGFAPTGVGPAVVPARVTEGPSIDGRLDDAVWQGAVRLTDFVQMNPLEGAAASEETEVYLAYDSDTFYVGVHAHYSDTSLVRANRVERDQTTRDDKLTLYFDPFLDQQRAYVFSVNGYGVQGDATLDSGGRSGGRRRQGPGGGRGRGPSGGPPGVIPEGDTSWDALYASAGGLVEDGWTAEMAIPFKSLRYPSRGSGEVHRWGLQIVRNIESKDERAVWSPVSRGISGFLTQMGTLDGMTTLSTSRNLEILPTVTAIQAGALNRSSGSFVDDSVSPEAGLNVKYGISSNLTADFTVNPDFSQIESDQPQIEVNQRFPLFFSELRPFFLEGQEIFTIPGPVTFVHTRTIVDPRFGAKLTGKVGRNTLGILVADDEAPGKRDDPTDPAFGQTAQFFVGRYRYDLYGESHIGALVTDREFMDGYNRIAGLDGQFRLGRTNRVNVYAFQSRTRDEVRVERSGPAYGWILRHSGRNLSYSFGSGSTDPDFRALAGFVRRVDEHQIITRASYRWWPENWLTNWGPRTNYSRNYDFDSTLQDEAAGAGLDFTFARSVTAGIGADRAMERFGGIDFWKWNYSTTFNINTSRLVSVEGNYDWGDGIFFSGSPFLGRSTGGRILSSVRPFSRLQSDVSVDFSQLQDPRTDAEVFDVKILRAFTTYQFTERFLLRNIMEYNTFDQTLDANILFTYRVNSGTVLFVGYDDHYQQGDFIDFGETIAERFLLADKLERTNRAFFTKLSYLFRY